MERGGRVGCRTQSFFLNKKFNNFIYLCMCLYVRYLHTSNIHGYRYTYATGDVYEGILKDDQYLEDGQYLAQEP